MIYSWKECHCLCKLNLICFQIMFRTIVQCFLDSATRKGNGSTSMGDVSSPHWLETVQTEYQGLCGNPLGDRIGRIRRTVRTSKKFLTMPLCVYLSLTTGGGKSDNPWRGEGWIAQTPLAHRLFFSSKLQPQLKNKTMLSTWPLQQQGEWKWK